MDKFFFHIDVNSAFLSWSAVRRLQLGDSVDLRTIPAVIGGDSSTRHGIVLAKSIPAKKFGIETAEPIMSALRKCPGLVIEPSDHGYYEEQSALFIQYLLSICPDIEQVSIDECYMDYTPIASKYDSPYEAAVIIKDTIKNKFGFTVNIGISDKKVLAKMASDFQKPDKIHTLYQNEIQSKMWPLSVSSLFMCGKSSVETLRKLGITTIGDLANAKPEVLNLHLKSHGQMLYEYANGIDSSDIHSEPSELKGVGNSTTLPKDLVTAEEAYPVLRKLAESVARRLREAKKQSSSVSVEIKYASFVSVSHQRVLAVPTDVSGELYQVSKELFDHLWNQSPIRLLGIRTTKLTDPGAPVQMDLFSYAEETMNLSVQADVEQLKKPSHEKLKRLDMALDEIKNKYGENAVHTGSTFSSH